MSTAVHEVVGQFMRLHPGEVARQMESAAPKEVAAVLAMSAELTLPWLLFVGLGTRLAALALLGMTAVIQLFVYPNAYDTHGTWAVCFLYLMKFGAGRLSLDHLLSRVWGARTAAA